MTRQCTNDAFVTRKRTYNGSWFGETGKRIDAFMTGQCANDAFVTRKCANDAFVTRKCANDVFVAWKRANRYNRLRQSRITKPHQR